MMTWYTQPPDGFSSFYSYDEDKLILVRIRLELGRGEWGSDMGETIVIYSRSHYVGFSERDYSREERERFLLDDDGNITYEGTKLSSTPVAGFFVYDFSSSNRRSPAYGVHSGNRVVDKSSATLPRGITEDHMRKLAEIGFERKQDIALTAQDEAEDYLTSAIRGAIITRGKGVDESRIDMPGHHRTRRRCCGTRCSII